MKAKLLYATLLFSFGITATFADEQVSQQTSSVDANNASTSSVEANFNDEYTNQYFYGDDESLTEAELNALKITTNWKDRSSKTKPVIGPNGSVQFIWVLLNFYGMYVLPSCLA